jgi:hypothetical protein
MAWLGNGPVSVPLFSVINRNLVMNAAVDDTKSTKVTYDNGETIEFTGSEGGDSKRVRRMVKKSFMTSDGMAHVEFYYRNGKRVDHAVDPKTPCADRDGASTLGEAFILHGMEQKYGDNLAGTTDYDEMLFDNDTLHEQLASGQWTSPREGGGPSGNSILFKALCLFKVEKDKCSEEEAAASARALLKKIDATQKQALQIRGPVSEIVKRLQKEKEASVPQVDTDALLVGL